MLRYEKKYWPLAVGLSGLAGYVDAIGFIKLGGLFVSFQSGNSTRLAVGLLRAPHVAMTAAGLIVAFVCGVVIGALVAHFSGRHRKPAVLLTVAMLLGLATLLDSGPGVFAASSLLAIAMGAENAVFQRDGEVTIGLTYMTGTLVKFGQRLAAALIGGDRWAWLPYLLLWAGLLIGAVGGATVYFAIGSAGIAFAAVAALIMAAIAAAIGGVAEAG